MIRRVIAIVEAPALLAAGVWHFIAPLLVDGLRLALRRRGGYRANLRVTEDPRAIEALAAELSKYEEFDDGPFVCPGCHCVGAEPHAADCIDERIRREREDAADREWDDHEEIDMERAS